MSWFTGEFKKSLGMLVILWLLWFFSGGPGRVEESKRPFLKPPSPLNSGEVFGELPKTNLGISPLNLKKDIVVGSPFDSSSININIPPRVGDSMSLIEINTLSTSKTALNITGWSIKGVMDKEARIIGTGAEVFYQGKVNPEMDIVLQPGEKAVIIAGESPVGASFKVNKCSGYLQQFQDFTPGFSITCPHPALDRTITITDESCSQFIRSIPRCSAFVNEFPRDITEGCKSLVNSNLTHNACLSKHIEDDDFYKAEWRIYVGGEDYFGSKNGDIVTIYDSNGNKIDSIFIN